MVTPSSQDASEFVLDVRLKDPKYCDGCPAFNFAVMYCMIKGRTKFCYNVGMAERREDCPLRRKE